MTAFRAENMDPVFRSENHIGILVTVPENEIIRCIAGVIPGFEGRTVMNSMLLGVSRASVLLSACLFQFLREFLEHLGGLPVNFRG